MSRFAGIATLAPPSRGGAGAEGPLRGSRDGHALQPRLLRLRAHLKAPDPCAPLPQCGVECGVASDANMRRAGAGSVHATDLKGTPAMSFPQLQSDVGVVPMPVLLPAVVSA